MVVMVVGGRGGGGFGCIKKAFRKPWFGPQISILLSTQLPSVEN